MGFQTVESLKSIRQVKPETQEKHYPEGGGPTEFIRKDGREQHVIGGTHYFAEVGDVVCTYSDGSVEIIKPDDFAARFKHEDGSPIVLNKPTGDGPDAPLIDPKQPYNTILEAAK